MPKWSHWLDDEYLENEPPKTSERIKRGQRQTEEVKATKKRPKPQPAPHDTNG